MQHDSYCPADGNGHACQCALIKKVRADQQALNEARYPLAGCQDPYTCCIESHNPEAYDAAMTDD